MVKKQENQKSNSKATGDDANTSNGASNVTQAQLAAAMQTLQAQQAMMQMQMGMGNIFQGQQAMVPMNQGNQNLQLLQLLQGQAMMPQAMMPTTNANVQLAFMLGQASANNFPFGNMLPLGNGVNPQANLQGLQALMLMNGLSQNQQSGHVSEVADSAEDEPVKGESDAEADDDMNLPEEDFEKNQYLRNARNLDRSSTAKDDRFQSTKNDREVKKEKARSERATPTNPWGKNVPLAPHKREFYYTPQQLLKNWPPPEGPWWLNLSTAVNKVYVKHSVPAAARLCLYYFDDRKPGCTNPRCRYGHDPYKLNALQYALIQQDSTWIVLIKMHIRRLQQNGARLQLDEDCADKDQVDLIARSYAAQLSDVLKWDEYKDIDWWANARPAGDYPRGEDGAKPGKQADGESKDKKVADEKATPKSAEAPKPKPEASDAKSSREDRLALLTKYVQNIEGGVDSSDMETEVYAAGRELYKVLQKSKGKDYALGKRVWSELCQMISVAVRDEGITVEDLAKIEKLLSFDEIESLFKKRKADGSFGFEDNADEAPKSKKKSVLKSESSEAQPEAVKKSSPPAATVEAVADESDYPIKLGNLQKMGFFTKPKPSKPYGATPSVLPAKQGSTNVFETLDKPQEEVKPQGELKISRTRLKREKRAAELKALEEEAASREEAAPDEKSETEGEAIVVAEPEEVANPFDLSGIPETLPREEDLPVRTESPPAPASSWFGRVVSGLVIRAKDALEPQASSSDQVDDDQKMSDEEDLDADAFRLFS